MAEKKKSVVLITNTRPPSEPPPSSEIITPHIEENQWVEDVITTAVQSLSLQDAYNATTLSTCEYTPRIKKLSTNRAINQQQLSIQRLRNNKPSNTVSSRCALIPPIVYELHIPTPKQRTRPHEDTRTNTIHHTTWKDEPSQHWKPNGDGTWKTPTTPETPATTLSADNTTHAIPYNKLLSRIKNARKNKIAHDHIEFHICTDPIQSDTGANENVTCNKSSIHNYVDIEPYPIGGVKADEVAIVCTGK